MSLHALATNMASKGRNGDSMLVHMTPGEVHGLQALAMKHGGSLTVNPDTGLPEANFLKSLLPMLAGFALGPAGFGLVSSGLTAGAIVGGVTGLATGSLSKGLMAGLGAYGGFGIGESLAGLGAAEMSAGSISSQMPTLAEGATQAQIDAYAQQVNALRSQTLASANAPGAIPSMDKLSAGFSSATASPTDALAFAKDNFKPLAAAAAPIMADMMVPTTTKASSPTDTGYIRQKIWDGRQFVDVGPVKASDWGSRNFSDVFTGRNYNAKDGGIVALAGGGVAHYEDGGGVTAAPAINSVEDLYTQVLGRAPDAGGLAYWQQGFGDTIDANEIASFKQAAQAELANRSAPEQQILAPNLVNTGGGAPAAASVSDLYQSILGRAPESEGAAGYWQNQFGSTIDANELAQFKTAAQAEIDARNAGTTGGIANLATTGGTSLADAQAQVNNMYRNVLGRDADPTGLAFWSNAFASGRPAESVYQDFLTSARANTELVREDQIKNKTFKEATTPYTGFMSTDTGNIVDEWVRTTLGREPTDADRQQQWYKDAANKMTTQGEAQGLFGQFKNYATKEATTEIANRIKAIDAELRAKGLTEADLLTQTGKTKQQLATEGLNTSLNWMAASQLIPAASRTKFDLEALKKTLIPKAIPNTFGGDAVDRTVTNPYGNATNPGDLTYNRDGSTTVTPNIPYRPYGGFPGIGAVRDAYTKGGGSLGYTSSTFNTIEEFNAKYLDRMGGDSRAAYDYLTGKGGAKYPTKSGVGQISKPYDEEVMGYPARTNVPYTYDKTSGKMVANPDYIAPSRDAKGNVTYGMSTNDIKKYLGEKPLAGQELYDWAQSNGISAQQVADATGRKLSDVYADFRAAAKKAAAKIGTGVGASGTYDIGGGGGDSGPAPGPDSTSPANSDPGNDTAKRGGLMQGYAMGGYALGGLGTLGGYSDGGRLLKGPGDGVSDSIPATIGRKQQPARLADGEFVVPARIVSELGNGSTDAGAKKLYAMMDRVQRARGKTTGKNKVAANSRADKYLPA